MITVISGSRDITDVRAVEGILRQYLSCKDTLIVGGARGVDQIAADFGYRYFMKVREIPADWHTHGRAAGPIRNKQMLEEGDRLVAIWDGKSRGTKNAIDTALKMRMETHVYFVEANQ